MWTVPVAGPQRKQRLGVLTSPHGTGITAAPIFLSQTQPIATEGRLPMYKIVRREAFSDVTFLWDVHAPDVAATAKPGHFVMLRLHEGSERIPLPPSAC